MPPRYLRFARALVLVSTALPAPVIAAELLLGVGCESDPPDQGVRFEGSSSGTSGAPAPGYGTSSGPALGTQPAPEVDSGQDAIADAGDGGGPGGGIPELPASWGRYA